MVDVAGTKGGATIAEGVPGVAGEGEAEVVVVAAIVSKYESGSVGVGIGFVASHYCNAKCSA